MGSPSPADVAEQLVAQFGRMVQSTGGALRVVAVDDDVIRIVYRAGEDPTCDGDACVLPHAELQQLMAETLARRAPQLAVHVDAADFDDDRTEV